MSATDGAWDAAAVRAWLDARCRAARLEQAAADRRGYAAADDYDQAAAQEWACRTLSTGDHCDSQAALAARIKTLLAQDEFQIAGIHDDRRCDRHIRANLRKIAKMVKANDGFANRLRYQD